MSGGGPKMVHFLPKMAGLSTFHSSPKRTKMVNQSVFLNLGPFWAHLDAFDHFRQKMIFCSEAEVKVPWKMAFFAIILPWMASYGFKISFLRMLASAKTNFPLLTLPSVCESSQPLLTGFWWHIKYSILKEPPGGCRKVHFMRIGQLVELLLLLAKGGENRWGAFFKIKFKTRIQVKVFAVIFQFFMDSY